MFPDPMADMLVSDLEFRFMPPESPQSAQSSDPPNPPGLARAEGRDAAGWPRGQCLLHHRRSRPGPPLSCRLNLPPVHLCPLGVVLDCNVRLLGDAVLRQEVIQLLVAAASIFSSCTSDQESMVTERTKLMCTPRPRWRPEHSRHMKIPYDTEAHCGFFWLQSTHTLLFECVCSSRSRVAAAAEAIRVETWGRRGSAKVSRAGFSCRR